MFPDIFTIHSPNRATSVLADNNLRLASVVFLALCNALAITINGLPIAKHNHVGVLL
jgi:hypothetical protein